MEEVKPLSSGESNKPLTPEVIQDTPFPDPVIADDVRNRDLDTTARRVGILGKINFPKSEYQAVNTISLSGTNSYTDVSGSELTFVLKKPSTVYISFFANVKLYATDPIRGYSITVAPAIDGTTQVDDRAIFEVSDMEAALGTCLSFIKPYELAAGEHTIKMKWATFAGVGDTSEMSVRGLHICVMGG